MKIKIVISVFTLLTFVKGFSLSKYGKNPEDSLVCIKSLIYKEYLKSDEKLALELWRKAMSVCPASQKTLYINGVKLYTKLMSKTKDSALKEAYKDTIYNLYDRRIKYFQQKGKVLALKAQTMLSFKSKKIKEIAAILKEAINLTGDKTGYGALIANMFVIVQMEKNKLASKDQVIEVYEKMIGIIDKNTNHPKYAKYYKIALEKVNAIAAAYLTCETIIEIANKNFDKNRNNIEWLNKMSNLLKYKKCFDASIFYKISEVYFTLDPNVKGAENLGLLYMSRKEYSKAEKYLNKAIEMDSDQANHAKYYLSLGRVFLLKKSYNKSRGYILKALKIKPDFSEAYELLGDVYSSSSKICNDGKLGKWAVYWLAEDKYNRAISFKKESEDRKSLQTKISNIKVRYPTQKDIFFFGKNAGTKINTGCWINENTTIRIKK